MFISCAPDDYVNTKCLAHLVPSPAPPNQVPLHKNTFLVKEKTFKTNPQFELRQSGTTAEIAPSSCRGIRSADHIGGKHQGAPELVGDEPPHSHRIQICKYTRGSVNDKRLPKYMVNIFLDYSYSSTTPQPECPNQDAPS